VPNRDLIVIGGSAGACRTLQELLLALPPDLPAAVIVVIHRAEGIESGRTALDATGTLRSKTAEDGDRIEHGRVLIAPRDRHVVVENGAIRLIGRPRENMWRPAIDVLFRSAAVTYQSRVIGVLLSGYLDDGTVGLQAIGTCGGVTIVQEPQESETSEMPRIALANVSIDYVLSIPQIAATLLRLASEAAPSLQSRSWSTTALNSNQACGSE
jgi:two-component system chemotaxis response regulator CheB